MSVESNSYPYYNPALPLIAFFKERTLRVSQWPQLVLEREGKKGVFSSSKGDLRLQKV